MGKIFCLINDNMMKGIFVYIVYWLFKEWKIIGIIE